MRVSDESDITRMLTEVRAGSPEAWGRLVAVVYADLRRMAHRQLSAHADVRTLDTTGLVHECYVRLVERGATADDRAHFFSLAARVMRQVIVDYARERLAEKRGGGVRALPLDDVDETEIKQAERFVAIDEALADLALADERRSRVVECRFFAGLTEEETAAALDLSLRTVQREWQAAREWLAQRLGTGGEP